MIGYPRTRAEISANVIPVNYAFRAGSPRRQGAPADGTASARPALVVQDSTGEQIYLTEGIYLIDADLTLSSAVFAESGAIFQLSSGVVLTLSGGFQGWFSKHFNLLGSARVAFSAGSIEAILPEWLGAHADATADGASGTDSTAAFEAAIASSTEDAAGEVCIHEVRATSGNYLVGNLIFPAAFRLSGTGRATTNFIIRNGTTGAWFTDGGSAAKIILNGFAMYGRNLTGPTHGLRLGYNTVQHGVEGSLRDIWVRDLPNAVLIDLNGNVAFYDRLAAYTGAVGIRITGIANTASKLVAYGCTSRGLDLNLVNVDGVEMEAPGNDCVPVYLSGNCAIQGLLVSLANGTTISHLVELTANATTWKVDQFCLAYGDNAASINVTQGNFKRADGSYFGGNASQGNRLGEGHYSSEQEGQCWQAFTVRITNSGSTLEHWIRDASNSGSASNAVARAITGRSGALNPTPNGPDASTAFGTGLKISSATPSQLIFDTPAQKISASMFMPSVVANTTGVPLSVIAAHQPINVNGVSRIRLVIQLLNAQTGSGFALNTSNIAPGQFVKIVFLGLLST